MEEIDLVRVKFPGRGTFAYDPNKLDLNVGDYCITEDIDNNVDFGQVVGKIKIQRRKFFRPIRKIVRKATGQDKEQFDENIRLELEAKEICRRKIKDRNLPMKLVSARYSPDNRKIMFYFTADRRIDFRELVKDLAYIFKKRIELRQIGVRDETRLFNGIGCCGCQLCCAGFLKNKKIGRVNIKMAKEQDMTLTPSKIAGVCGKLLCCLQYENESYHQMKEEMPDIGNTVKTETVSGKVEGVDIFSGTIKVRDNEEKLVEVKVDEVKKPARNVRRRRRDRSKTGGTGNE